MNERADISGDEPPIEISFQLPMDDGTGRVVVFRSMVPQSCPDEHFNAVLDKLSRAGERQKSLVLLPTYESDLDAKREAHKAEIAKLFLASQERDMEKEKWQREAAASNRRNWRPSAAQSQAMQKLDATVGQCEQNIRVFEKQIASEQQRVNLYKGRLGKGE